MPYRFLQGSAVMLHYEETGSGIPLLAVHGFSPDLRIMSGCLEPVFRSHPGWRRVYVDLPGMGGTAGTPELAHTDRILDVLREFFDVMFPGEQVALVGESYGGYLVRGLLRERFDRILGVMLLCPAVEPIREKRRVPPKRTLRWDDAFLATLSPEDRAQFEMVGVVCTEEVWRRTDAEVLAGIRCADQTFLSGLAATRLAASVPYDPPPRPFEGPSLFLAGRQDHIVGYEELFPLLVHYPRATLAVLDMAGHNLQIEQPHLFSILTEDWLQRLERISR